MCYIPTTLVCEGSEHITLMPGLRTKEYPNGEPTVQCKRTADDHLDVTASKKQKFGHDDDQAETFHAELTLDKLQKDLQRAESELIREQEKNAKLTEDIVKLLEENARSEDARIEAESRAQLDRGRAEDAEENKKQSVSRSAKKIVESEKMKWAGKAARDLERLRAQHENDVHVLTEKHNKMLNRETSKLQSALGSLKECCAKKIQAKDDKLDEWKAEYQEKLKIARKESREAKEGYARLSKEVRAEQKAEIEKARPETNAEVKKLKAANDKLDADVTRLKRTLEASDCKTKGQQKVVGRLEAGKADLEKFVQKQSDTEAFNLVERRESDQRQTASLIQHTKLLADSAELNEHLQRLERRWRLQCDKTESIGLKLVEQQRANFSLKHSVNKRDVTIASLKQQIARLLEAKGDEDNSSQRTLGS
jgi:hypothetical protein